MMSNELKKSPTSDEATIITATPVTPATMAVLPVANAKPVSASSSSTAITIASQADQNLAMVAFDTLEKRRKRSLPGTPDPEAEVVALTPEALTATHQYICEICNKEFRRNQNLQLHQRGHNFEFNLHPRPSDQVVRKRVYVCPEPSCIHHDPIRALGDLTGIKKHFRRKHGEKKWECSICSKKYAVETDLKTHMKSCRVLNGGRKWKNSDSTEPEGTALVLKR